jgi:thiamine biosynthesis protein ThiS
MSVTDLLRRLNLTTDGIAVAINASVVTRKNHAHTIVHDGDTIEIIRAVAGG